MVVGGELEFKRELLRLLRQVARAPTDELLADYDKTFNPKTTMGKP